MQMLPTFSLVGYPKPDKCLPSSPLRIRLASCNRLPTFRLSSSLIAVDCVICESLRGREEAQDRSMAGVGFELGDCRLEWCYIRRAMRRIAEDWVIQPPEVMPVTISDASHDESI